MVFGSSGATEDAHGGCFAVGCAGVVVGITGASGVIYGVEILRALKKLDVPSHLIVSEAA